MPTSIAEERVQAGVAYLDAEFPGWEAYIDRAELDMGSGWHCLIAQLAAKMPAFAEIAQPHSSPYLNVVRWLVPEGGCAARDAWGYLYGFADAGDGGVDTGVTYTDLQTAWLGVLEERQAVFAVRPGSTPEPAPMTSAEDEAFRDEYESRGVFGDE